MKLETVDALSRDLSIKMGHHARDIEVEHGQIVAMLATLNACSHMAAGILAIMARDKNAIGLGAAAFHAMLDLDIEKAAQFAEADRAAQDAIDAAAERAKENR